MRQSRVAIIIAVLALAPPVAIVGYAIYARGGWGALMVGGTAGLAMLTLEVGLGVLVELIFPKRRRRQQAPDAVPCPKCGYDLRATPERCPECGTPVQKPIDDVAKL